MAVDMSMNILIVDDYKTMLRIIRNLLKAARLRECGRSDGRWRGVGEDP